MASGLFLSMSLGILFFQEVCSVRTKPEDGTALFMMIISVSPVKSSLSSLATVEATKSPRTRIRFAFVFFDVCTGFCMTAFFFGWYIFLFYNLRFLLYFFLFVMF